LAVDVAGYSRLMGAGEEARSRRYGQFAVDSAIPKSPSIAVALHCYCKKARSVTRHLWRICRSALVNTVPEDRNHWSVVSVFFTLLPSSELVTWNEF
jgi:hypothetical protein